jgi:hypothetical protein
LECVKGVDFELDNFYICLKYPKFDDPEDENNNSIKDYNFKFFKWTNIEQMFSFKFDRIGFYVVYLLLVNPDNYSFETNFMKNEVFKCTGFYPLYNWIFVSNEMIEKFDYYCTHNVKVDPFIKNLKQKYKLNLKGIV